MSVLRRRPARRAHARIHIAVAFALVAALSSCTPTAGSPSASPTPSSSVDLAAARAQAGIPDCPITDPAAAAVEGGLPQTSLACLGGGRQVNLAGLPRRPMVVNLWAQWCGPCREESGFIAEASRALGDRVAFVGINYNDPQEDWAVEFAGLVKWQFPHVVDPEKSLQAPLRLAGIPVTLFVGADGRIVYRHAGAFTSTAELTDAIAANLGVR